MRKQIAAGNWKMNLSLAEAVALAKAVSSYYKEGTFKAEVILAVPAPYLVPVQQELAGVEGVFLAGQNIHQAEKGAYTGENAVAMIADVGATHCLVGHSERRSYFNEGNALLAEKVDRLLAANLIPIYCIGESLAQREEGKTMDVNAQQIEEGLFHLSADEFSKVILAYEPIWAIGTGVTASPEQAQEVHQELRALVAGKYGKEIAENLTILYGGSVKPANADALFAKNDIDGGLVGGASLKADAFSSIIAALG